MEEEVESMARYNHFVVRPESSAEDMFRGVAASYPSLTVDHKSRIILYSQNDKSKCRVGLLSGGGSGHEPFSAGFVGEGMLTGAVGGKVFTSPPPTTILTTICNVAEICSEGVLVFILNYTGDVLNFGLAMERAKLKGIKVKSIYVEEDCAIDSPKGAGRRGLCGCLFMFKIAGGMAILGKSLDEIYNECNRIKKNNATFGVTIKPCNLPGVGPMFEVESGYMEVGIGIHGEAGAFKSKISSGDEIANILMEKLCKTLHVKAGDRVCVIVNNLGGSSQLELFLMAGLINDELGKRGVVVERLYTGVLMSSLDMAGIQVSLLLLPESDDHRKLWLDTLDSPTNAFAWPATSLSLRPVRPGVISHVEDTEAKIQGPKISDVRAEVLRSCLKAAAEAIVVNEQKLNDLDKGCGDGDTGSTLRRMANAILQDLDGLPVSYPQQCFTKLSKMAEDVMGGTSGALYSLMFVGASKQVPDWSAAFGAALTTAMTYSKATLGSRTMFDALIPAYEEFKTSTASGMDTLQNAVKAADLGCQRTRFYKPLFGRASYVAEENISDMDAGAYAATVWLNAIVAELSKHQ